MNPNKYILTFLFFILILGVQAQSKYPATVEVVLQQAKGNRVELEKSLDYFYKGKDSLKIKAINFLIENMPIHRSYNYYWADSLDNRLPYNELDYPSFDSSIKAFEALKAVTPKIHPVPNNYNDIDSIKGDYHIENVNRAFAELKQPWSNNLSFSDFCEYLLPYRVSIEPLEDWRGLYEKKFAWIMDSTKNQKQDSVVDFFENDCLHWFENTFFSETRKEPLPRLDALRLLHRKKGACEDRADVTVLEMRSQGIPAAVDFIPHWATSTWSHFLWGAPTLMKTPKEINTGLTKLIPPGKLKLPREPGKVLRTTYSKQAGTLASIVNPDNIPQGFLRSVNYVDVTDQYWETKDVEVPINQPMKSKISPVAFMGDISGNEVIYACVLNSQQWKVEWWGRAKGNAVKFNKLGKGAVYLPMRYTNKFLMPAGYPMAVGYNESHLLQPDTANRHTIHLPQQDKYLIYRPGKKYTLYYWGNKWITIGTQTAADSTTELVFEKVPKNALLLLVPEYTQHKDRPFEIMETGERVWW